MEDLLTVVLGFCVEIAAFLLYLLVIGFVVVLKATGVLDTVALAGLL